MRKIAVGYITGGALFTVLGVVFICSGSNPYLAGAETAWGVQMLLRGIEELLKR